MNVHASLEHACAVCYSMLCTSENMLLYGCAQGAARMLSAWYGTADNAWGRGAHADRRVKRRMVAALRLQQRAQVDVGADAHLLIARRLPRYPPSRQ